MSCNLENKRSTWYIVGISMIHHTTGRKAGLLIEV